MFIRIKFSVVTVVFNGEREISKTIESVLNQTYSPFEYIILDGDSDDRTVEIANSYKPLFKNKGIDYYVFSEKDSGIYNAMNKGIRICKGDFISFLNAGDWYENDALSIIKSYYDENAFDLTYGGLHYITPDGSVINKMSKEDRYLITSRHWNHPSMFLRRELYQKYGFDERFKTYSDFHLYTKLRKTDIKICIVPKIITNFPADGVSTDTSLKKVILRANEKYRIYRDNGYSCLYWFESYGWEFIKSLVFRIKNNKRK